MELEKIRDTEELLDLVKKATGEEGSQEYPPLLDLVHKNGNTLVVGITGGGGYISFTDKDGDPPYYVSSSGNESDRETVWFDYGGHATEISKRNIVDKEKVVKAIKDFYLTGKLPDVINWEEA
jgi:hypothetical protein